MRVVLWCLVLLGAASPALAADGEPARPAPPVTDPAASYGLPWTGGFAWDRVLDVTAVPGDNWDARIRAGLEQLARAGGGVLYLPAGDYGLTDSVRLPSGVVLRGADPVVAIRHNPKRGRPPEPVRDARDARYDPPTRLVFPRYDFSAEGEGTPTDTAFKGIHLADEAGGHLVGAVHLVLENGHVRLGTRESLAADWRGPRATGRFLIYGCVLRNSAVATSGIPRLRFNGKPFQHPWQRFTDPDVGAITAWASADVLVANNRIPRSGEADFLQEGYRLLPRQPRWLRKEKRHEDLAPVEAAVPFDHDNRSGVRVNVLPVLKQLAIWEKKAEIQAAHEAGTVDAMLAPGALATGIVVADNGIVSTGRAAIKCCGDGTRILRNHIRFVPDVVRPTSGGTLMDAHSNGNRAIEIRGWRWEIADNDYEVYCNLTPAGMEYNDGEGIMHEAWENVGVRDSRLTGNVGNAYLCFWRVPVRGLLIAGNRIRVPGYHAIFVNSQIRTRDDYLDLAVYGLRIEDNRTQGSGIAVVGAGTRNLISGNVHTPLQGQPGFLVDEVGITQRRNVGYVERLELER